MTVLAPDRVLACAVKHYLDNSPHLKRVDFGEINDQQDDLAGEMETDLIDISDKIRQSMIDQVGALWGEKSGANIDPLDAEQVEVPPKLKTIYRKAVRDNLDRTYRVSVKTAKKELPVKQMAQVIKSGFDKVGADRYLASKSFQVTGIMDADVLKQVQNAISNGIKFDNTRSQIEQAIDAILVEAASPLSPARIETIARTNISDAYNQARLSAFNDPALDGFVQAYEYAAILDSRTTAVCSNLDGKKAVDFGEFTPPNHMNCRSLLIPITEIDDFTPEDLSTQDEITAVPPNQGFGTTQTPAAKTTFPEGSKLNPNPIEGEG